jgi:protein involved in polysaccharide export with SLBB domain
MSRLIRAVCHATLTTCLAAFAAQAFAQAAGGPFGSGAGGGGAAAAAAALGMGGGDPNGMGGSGGPGGSGGFGAGGDPSGGASALGLQRGMGRPGLPAARTSGLDAADPAQSATPMRALAPLEPGDFQKFVQAGTGRMLPLFGASLFDEAPTTFAPIGAVPVPADYVVGPGDEIIVRSTGVLDFELRPVVDRDGQIVLPKVGAVQVSGVRMAELERFLTQQVGKSFRNFTLSASLGQLRGIDVYVVGQARRPGKYTLSSLSTLVNALFASGGPNANGSMRRVRLVRADRSIVTLDLYDFIVKGDKSRDVKLLPGDVIVFPSAGPRVAITGALNTPAVYELVGNDTPISELLALSGGMQVLANPLKAQLERVDPGQKAARVVEDFALDDAGLARRLRDGDLLTLFPISPQFANAVTLRGTVAQPLRYPHKAGMRIRDLIPEPAALITRDYWLKKNLMVQFEDAPLTPTVSMSADPGARTQSGRDAVLRDALSPDAGQRVTAEKTRQDIRNVMDEVNWDYAVIERLDPRELKTELIPFNLGRAVLQNDATQNIELRPGDVVTIFSKRDLQVPRGRQSRVVKIEGEVAAPGIYMVASDETLPQLIARIGGTTREAYLFGTELNRESVRKQQQQSLETIVKRLEDQASAGLATRQASVTATDAASAAAQQQRLQVEERLVRERLQRLRAMKPSGRIALELDPSSPMLPPMVLEDGDRVIVPPRPSFVSLVGAVHNENVLLWRPGRTVRDYLDSAGPTDSADADNLFVLRADGSIASRRDTSGWFGGGSLFALQLAAGDTIVVPEKVDRETKYAAFMRGLKDWTQVVYQLGLGAAAIKVLRD